MSRIHRPDDPVDSFAQGIEQSRKPPARQIRDIEALMTHWTQTCSQPNATEVIQSRRDQLIAARQPPVSDRTPYIIELVRGKRVLDVGVVDHVTVASNKPDWLHRRICEAASYCLGIDILKTGIQHLRDAGFNVACCDITREVPEGGPYDVVVCGEVIEHVGNPQGLFENTGRALAPGGRLVLTSPNPYYLGRTLRHLFGRDRESVDHVTLLFPSGIAELASRSGMRLERYRGVHARPESMKQRVWKRVQHLTSVVMSKDTACGTIIYECVKPGRGEDAVPPVSRATAPAAAPEPQPAGA